ncbi:MAG: elongation factor 1-beta [Candidatus Micrarchaeota archaeon]
MEEYNVAARLKIYLDGPASLDGVKSGIEKLTKVQRFWEEDVGFGIKVLKVNILMKDSEGGMEALESSIRNIKGVSELEVEEVGRV